MNDWTPTAKEICDERYYESLTQTERELYDIRLNMLNGKIPLESENDKNRTSYEDAIGCTLFYALQNGEITEEESNALWSKYVRKGE